MTEGRAVLIGLIQRYFDGLLDPSISLLEIHKLMYFMQVLGEKLKLNYKKEFYGPHAENLRHVLRAIEGHYIQGYGDGGDEPQKNIELLSGALQKAQAVLEQHNLTKQRFEVLSEFIEGFESSFGLELLATVHWVELHDKPSTPEELVKQVYQWNISKKKFSAYQIQLASDRIKQFFPMPPR